MKQLLIMSLLALLSGCGLNVDVGYLDSELEEYVLFIHNQNNINTLNKVSYRMVNSLNKNDVAALCKRNTLYNAFSEAQERVVVIPRDGWENWSDELRLAVLAHEIGHCYLELEHEHNSFLMQSSLSGMYYKYKHNPSLVYDDIKELFNGNK